MEAILLLSAGLTLAALSIIGYAICAAPGPVLPRPSVCSMCTRRATCVRVPDMTACEGFDKAA